MGVMRAGIAELEKRGIVKPVETRSPLQNLALGLVSQPIIKKLDEQQSSITGISPQEKVSQLVSSKQKLPIQTFGSTTITRRSLLGQAS